jgi:hypothetical protein
VSRASSRAGRIAATLSALALLVAAGGCGGDDEGEGGGDLAWRGSPRVVVPPQLPGDRILRGTVVNDSLRPVDISAKDVRVVDADGERLDATVLFLSSFVRSLEPYNRGPVELPDDELVRLGRKVSVKPGKTAPLTVSWREREGRAVAIEYGPGSLPVPKDP